MIGNLALSRALGDFEFKTANLPPEQQAVTGLGYSCFAINPCIDAISFQLTLISQFTN